jgi:hypothetical protein
MASPAVKTRNAAEQKPMLVPDQKFWKHYSPHHELPLSTASSLLIHITGITVLIVGSIVLARLGLGDHPRVEVGEIALDPGGGGRADGAEGPKTGIEPKREAASSPTSGEDARTNLPSPQELKDVNVKPAPIIESARPPERLIEQHDLGTSGKFAAVDEILKAALDGTASKGRNGPGEKDGSGAGSDKGNGKDKGKLSQQQKRQQRWVLLFNTRDGDDYAKQLKGLKALLAVPMPKDEKQFLLIEDLSKRPVQTKKSDLATIKRIYWIDDKPESVASLARALGLKPVPSFIVAFFPEELEKDLLKKELAYRHQDEDKIDETRFQVKPKRNSGYEAVVLEQRVR